MNLIPNLTVIIFCVYFKTISGAIDKPLVTISDGDLLGSIEEARNGRQYFRFLGIPYGVVEQRFGVRSSSMPNYGRTQLKYRTLAGFKTDTSLERHKSRYKTGTNVSPARFYI